MSPGMGQSPITGPGREYTHAYLYLYMCFFIKTIFFL